MTSCSILLSLATCLMFFAGFKTKDQIFCGIALDSWLQVKLPIILPI